MYQSRYCVVCGERVLFGRDERVFFRAPTSSQVFDPETFAIRDCPKCGVTLTLKRTRTTAPCETTPSSLL